MLLTFLTIQIYLIAKYPIRSKLMISGKKIGLSCILIWILAILLGLSNIAYIRPDLSLGQLMKIYIAQISVLELSVLVQAILKVLIIREIMKNGPETEVLVNAEQSNTKHKEIAKTIVILNVILIVTAFPYFVAKQIEYLYKLEVIQDDVLARLFSNNYEPIAALNFALNPILYSLRLSDYRRSLIVLFCTCFHRNEDFAKGYQVTGQERPSRLFVQQYRKQQHYKRTLDNHSLRPARSFPFNVDRLIKIQINL